MSDLILSPIRLNELEALIEKSVRKAIVSHKQETLEKLFSITEAAEFLSLAPQTLYGFTSKRLIPFMKRGKRLYFKESELLMWIEQGKRKTSSEIMQENDVTKRKGLKNG